jgi:hypothetical protein
MTNTMLSSEFSSATTINHPVRAIIVSKSPEISLPGHPSFSRRGNYVIEYLLHIPELSLLSKELYSSPQRRRSGRRGSAI